MAIDRIHLTPRTEINLFFECGRPTSQPLDKLVEGIVDEQTNLNSVHRLTPPEVNHPSRSLQEAYDK